MSESTIKHRKRYLDHTKDKSKLTCHIHGPINSSDECKVLGDFGTKYDTYRSTKDHRQDPATKKSFGRQQENNTMIQHVVDEIILQQNEKLSVKYETRESIYNEVNEDDLPDLENISLDKK